MQSLLKLPSSCGLPLCLSGIINPLTFYKEMKDHDLRREAMKKQKSKSKEVSEAYQEMGVQRNVDRMIWEMMEGEVDEDLEILVNVFSYVCLQLPCSAKAA